MQVAQSAQMVYPYQQLHSVSVALQIFYVTAGLNSQSCVKMDHLAIIQRFIDNILTSKIFPSVLYKVVTTSSPEISHDLLITHIFFSLQLLSFIK